MDQIIAIIFNSPYKNIISLSGHLIYCCKDIINEGLGGGDDNTQISMSHFEYFWYKRTPKQRQPQVRILSKLPKHPLAKIFGYYCIQLFHSDLHFGKVSNIYM